MIFKNSIWQFRSTPLFIVLALSASFANAAVTFYSSNFSTTSGTNSAVGWTYSGAGGGVSRSTTNYDNLLSGGSYGGDGVKGDGALAMNTGDGISGNEMWTYDLGTPAMTVGDVLGLEGTAFNANSSHNLHYYVSIFNVTDNRVLTITPGLGRSRAGAATDDINPMVDFFQNYTVTADDLGDVFQIRVTESLDNVARDGFLDWVSVTSSAPEPTRALLLAAGMGGLLLRRRRQR